MSGAHAGRVAIVTGAAQGIGRGVEAVIAAASDDRGAGLEADRRARRVATQTGRSLPDIATWLLMC